MLRSVFPRPLFRMDLAQYVSNDAGLLVPTEQSLPEYERRAQDSFVQWLVSGMVYGDEWKWKVVDWLMGEADVAVRFQWGHNAGHTVKVWDQEFDLHIIPSSLVYDWKEWIIARTCVLGVDLPKLLAREIKDTNTWEMLWKIFTQGGTWNIVCNHSYDELLKRNTKDNWKPVRSGLLPEIEKLESKWKTMNWRLFISEEVPLIWVHHILIDAFLEQVREANGLRAIGSTGSGISPAYASIPLRYNISLGMALRNPQEYFQSMRAEWEPYKRFFPLISIDSLIDKQKNQIEIIRSLYKEWKIKIGDEKVKINQLRKDWKKIVGEWAQAVLIGSDHSIYGTASSPNVQVFCNATGVSPEEIANLFLVYKLPPSSVGTRAIQFMRYVESAALQTFRQKYREFGVSTGRPRDLVKISLFEIAEAVRLVLLWTSQYLSDRIVPVLNRADWLNDFSTLTWGSIPVATWFSYTRPNLEGKWNTHESWWVVVWDEKITPDTLLRWYPSRSDWSSEYMFNSAGSLSERLVQWDFSVSTDQIGMAVHNVVQYIIASIFKSDSGREVILGTSPDRSWLVLARDIFPKRI